MTGEPERMYKVVLAGDAAVGKSSFIMRLCKNKFVPNLNSTLGKNCKNLDLKNKTEKICMPNISRLYHVKYKHQSGVNNSNLSVYIMILFSQGLISRLKYLKLTAEWLLCSCGTLLVRKGTRHIFSSNSATLIQSIDLYLGNLLWNER